MLSSERKQGVARVLTNKALILAKKENCSRVSLSTANDNVGL